MASPERIVAAAVSAAALLWSPSSAAERDLTELGIEDLMSLKVFAASKYRQNPQDAPAAVSIVTADDIRAFGWRTLGDLLRAQRGMYMSYDRIYGYLGVRGILVSGDLNSRMIVTLDGHRINDVVYEQAFVLNDFILDTDLIERVEVVRGPGSSLHGATPLFGVINIVTRDPQRMPAHEASAEAGSFGWRAGRYTFTRLFDDNASLMLSVGGLATDGPDLTFNYPRFAGTTRGTDFEKAQRLFAKYESDSLRIMLAHSRRDKGVATGATGAIFDNPANRYIDTQTAFNIAYTWRLRSDLELEGRLFAGAYDFNGTLLYNDVPPVAPAIVVNKDLAQGSWQGTEWKLTHRGPAHTWVAGVEWQNNARQNQQNHYLIAGQPRLDDARSSHRYGVYFQDEWRHAPQAALTLGLRYDVDYRQQGHLSPRLAWVWNPDAGRTLKLIASQAFRAPNVAEAHYAFGTRFIANPALRHEHIDTFEAEFTQHLSPATRVTVNPYHFDLHDRISQVTTPGGIQYQNTGAANVTGVELELEHRIGADSRLRASYSRQRGRDNEGRRLTDSPNDIVTLNYSREILGDRLRLGAECQYVGSRLTFAGGDTGSSQLLNLTLGGRLWKRGPEWSAGLYNALDRRYSTPDTPDPDAGLNRDRIEQDGRSWRVKLTLPL